FSEVHVGGVRERVELKPGLLERIEPGKELLFAELLCREAAFRLVVGVHEVFHLKISSLRIGARWLVPPAGASLHRHPNWAGGAGARILIVPGERCPLHVEEPTSGGAHMIRSPRAKRAWQRVITP